MLFWSLQAVLPCLIVDDCSSDWSYEIAKSFSYEIVPTFASLVKLQTKESFVKDVSGVKFEGRVSLHVEGSFQRECKGDVLFTNYGVSGSAVLDISRFCADALLYGKSVILKVDLLPSFSKEALKNLLKSRLKFSNAKPVSLWLEALLNKKTANLVVKLCNFPKSVKSADDLGQKDINRLVYAIKEMTLHVESTKGFKSAEVTSGGVSVEEIDSNTMESKKVKGLYFSGEVLDIDGDCGGFNLHWAWASGYVAGLAMAR